MKYYNNMARQAGMTLIELTVVLLILIGLAGLLVPYVGSFSQTTHDSTNSNNITQLNNAMGKYIGEKNRIPPHVDLLTNALASATGTGTCTAGGANTAAWEVYCGLANPGLFTPTTIAVNTPQAISLANSGISMAVANDPNIENKTFGTSAGMIYLNDATAAAPPAMAPAGSVSAYDGTTTVAVVNALDVNGDGTPTVQEHLAYALGRDAMVYDPICYNYIAVGLGDNNELIQSTMAAAPVYFPQDANFNPTNTYSHFLAIIQVDAANTGNGAMGMPCSGFTEKAKFMGIAANVPSSENIALVGINTLLSQGWTNRAAN